MNLLDALPPNKKLARNASGVNQSSQPIREQTRHNFDTADRPGVPENFLNTDFMLPEGSGLNGTLKDAGIPANLTNTGNSQGNFREHNTNPGTPVIAHGILGVQAQGQRADLDDGQEEDYSEAELEMSKR
jgi:hypothetical protein